MTAEVVILNREAVAIAADSAATVVGRGPKIYNSANKLFSLSAVEPAAVMIYGAGAFGPIPWETVVKEYRRARGAQAFATVAERAADFIDHLSGLTQHVSREEQLERVATTARWELDRVRETVEQAILAASGDGAVLDDAAVTELIVGELDATIEHLAHSEPVEGLSAAVVEREIGSAVRDWPGFVKAAFEGLLVDERVARRSRVLVAASLRLADRSPGRGGVVIAGFGQSELFPAISSYLLDGVVANRVRVCLGGHVNIDGRQSAAILPFAQRDMVATFMDGIDPDFRLALDAFVREAFDLLSEHLCGLAQRALTTEGHDRLREDARRACAALTGQFGGLLDEYLERNNSGPIMSMVAVLPKEELAEMAEALVDLTSFKRRVTPSAETVGGPTDVAVISKGDGLVWIKRKQYFDAALNHRYFERDRRSHGSGTMGGTL